MPLYELTEDLGRGAVLDALAAIPAQLAQTMLGVSPVRLATRRAPADWSAFETLSHMRDAAIVYSARFRWIVFDDNPFLPNYDENNWVSSSRDTATDAAEMLAEIAASRRDLMRVLGRLPEEAWARTGRHEVLGQLVLEPYVRHQLAHEQIHIAQIDTALGS
jgi:DinB superfamily